MAHNIANINGIDSVFLANNSAWHGLGQVVVGAQTWKDAIQLANLNWSVEKQQLHDRFGSPVTHWGIFRDGQVFLGAVGKSYTPIQNEYAFEFVDTLLGVTDGAHYETAGALGNGERIWTLARIPYDYNVAGVDKHQTYLLFTTSHDGSLAATCKLTSVRVVCQNTLNTAMAMNGSFTRVKHTKQAEVKLEKAKKLMGNVVNGVKDIEDKLNLLSTRIIDKESYISVLDKLFPTSDNGGNKDKVSSRRDNILLEITKLFESNDNNAFPEFRGTAYNMLNAITEYTDHSRTVRLTIDRPDASRNMEMVRVTRKEQALFGTGDALKSKTLDTIIDLTKDCRTKDSPIYFMPPVSISENTPHVNLNDSFNSQIDPDEPSPFIFEKVDNKSVKLIMQALVAEYSDAKIYVREIQDEFEYGLKVIYVSDKEYIGSIVYRSLADAIAAIAVKWSDAKFVDVPRWEVYNN